MTPEVNRIAGLDAAIVRTLFDDLSAETVNFTKYRNYYDGEQGFVYGTEKFKELFPDFKGLKDNWCGVVIDAMADKMKLIGIELDSKDGNEEGENPIAKQIWDAFRRNDIDEQQADLTEGVFVEGRAAVLVWPDEELGVRVDWQPASLVKVRYSEEDYRKPVVGVKRWVTPSGEIRVNVYDDKEVRKYTEGKDQALPEPQKAGTISATIPQKSPTLSLSPRFVEGEEWPLPHDFEMVPIVEFHNKRGSELKDVIPLQDGINYLLVSAFVAGEFSALKQKIFFTHLKAPPGGWSNKPGRVWHLPPMVDSDGKLLHGQHGEFNETDLSGYRQIIEMVLQHLALTSKTPVRMFFKSDRGGRGDAPSGESELIEDEPLLDKVADRMTKLGNRWFQVARLVGKALGIEGELLGEMLWQDPRTKYRTSLLDEGIKYAAPLDKGGLGLPIEWVVKRLGLSPEELAELQELLTQQLEEEKALQEAMVKAEAAGGNGNGNTGSGTSGPQSTK
jgi:hypothetical protein